MYKIESELYKRRKLLSHYLSMQFSSDNRFVFTFWSITIAVMEYAHLSWRDWLSGHITILFLVIAYLMAQRWIGNR